MTEEQAKQRFLILNLVRLSGLMVTMLGMANIMGKFAPGLAPFLGGVLIVMGAADFFFAPILLKRMWRGETD
jgi:hypothetical protein